MGEAWPCVVFFDGRALPEERRDRERWLVRASSCEPRSMGIWKLTSGRLNKTSCPKPRNGKAINAYCWHLRAAWLCLTPALLSQASYPSPQGATYRQ